MTKISASRKELKEKVSKETGKCSWCSFHGGENKSRGSRLFQKGWKLKRKKQYKKLNN